MARWNHKKFIDKLTSALDCVDHRKCSDLCAELIQHLHTSVEQYDIVDARAILATLRRKQYFDLMAQVSDALLRTGIDDPQIRRQYAQALLDQAKIYPALAILQQLIASKNVPADEQSEARGLVGRAYKQIYMDASDSNATHVKDALRKAIESYYQVFKDDDNKNWHGVNAIALLARAYRDGIEVDVQIDYKELAKQIIAKLSEDDARDARMWELGTLAEAYIALHDWANATKYLNRYIHQNANAFELGSTLRQFEEVWQLDTDEMAERAIIDRLRSELLKKSGGQIQATAGSIRRASNPSSEPHAFLQKVFGDTGYQSYQWLLLAMQAARSVGRVWQGPKGVGTGFILPGLALSPEWDGKQVFVTNNHVISKPKGHYIALHPEQVTITFDVLNDNQSSIHYRVADLLWQSGLTEFDTTVLQLDKTVKGTTDYTLATSMPSKRESDRIYVIGHPQGGELSFSFQDNTLIDFNERLLHYRSPTDPGSSGSPIFNENWELIGLHHAGSEDFPMLNGNDCYPANEGIALPAIIDGIAKYFSIA